MYALHEPFELFMFADLVFFHAYLYYRGQTTYEYITMKRDVAYDKQVFDSYLQWSYDLIVEWGSGSSS